MCRKLRDLFLRSLVLLCLLGVAIGRAGAAVPNPPRDLEEVRAVLAKAPKPAGEQKPLNILLVANRKDHGDHEHDYPRWLERWKVLLGGAGAGKVPVNLYGLPAEQANGPARGAPGVTVDTARDWPTQQQLARADLVVAFMGTGGIWNEAKLRDLKALLDRGAGFVALHSAVIAEKPHAQPLADLLGLAWESGHTLFRHGPLDLKITDPRHPICVGLPKTIRFEDETYWPLIGDASKVTVLGTADEPAKGTGKLAPQPMFWTHTAGKGRVFNSILGHYTWTFDDPFFRILVLRGMAWAAGESPYRFDSLVLSGARTTERKPIIEQQPRAAPIVPTAEDPDLLLWLDASDLTTLAVAPDGRVQSWSSRTRGGARLTSEAKQQPVFIEKALGGRPTIRFDGIDDALRDTAFRQSAGEWTVAIVTTPRSNAGLFRSLMAANRPDQDDFQTGFNIDLGPGETPTFSALNIEGIKAGGATNLRTASTPFGEGQILILSTGEGATRLWVNGGEEESRGANAAVTVMDELRLGGRFYLGREQGFYHGEISEVLLFKSRLSDAKRASLAAHLLQKYSVPFKQTITVQLDPWDYLPAYDWASTRRPLAPIDEAVARSRDDANSRRTLEERLLLIATDPANPPAARDYALRHLGVVGSRESVRPLSSLLTDEALSNLALFALERIPDGSADSVLLRALDSATGRLRIGVITALAARGAATAVPSLASLLADPDAPTRQAAALALGRIGGGGAIEALLQALESSTSETRPVAAASLLQIAEGYRVEGRVTDASRLYQRLLKEDVPESARHGAVRGTVLVHGAKRVDLLVQHLRDPNPQSRAMALLLIQQAKGSEMTRALAARLPSLPPAIQAKAISALAERGDAAARPAVRSALRSIRIPVQLAAIDALGKLGDVSDVARLTGMGAGGAPFQAAAAKSLARLSGPDIDAALLRIAQRGDVSARRVAIIAIGRRGIADAATMLVSLARGQNPVLRLAAIQALGGAATGPDAAALSSILASAKGPDEIQAAESSLTELYGRTENKTAWLEAQLSALQKAGPKPKVAMLRLVTRHGGPKAMRAVRDSASSTDPEVRDAAVRLLCDWPTAEPANDLLEIVRKSDRRNHQILALRGYLRMAGLPDLPAARRLEMCREGLRLAQRDDERRLAIGVLGTMAQQEALAAVLPFLETENLKEEAGLAAVGIGQRLLTVNPLVVAQAMDRVQMAGVSESLARQAADIRARSRQAGSN